MSISVLIPSFNRPNLLAEAIRSVKAADYKDVEIVVLDVSNEDQKEAVAAVIAEFPGVKLHHQKNIGAANTANELLKLATHDIVTFLCDDDQIGPSYYTKALSLLDLADMVVSQAGFIDAKSYPIGEEHAKGKIPKFGNMPSEEAKKRMFSGTPCIGGPVFRKSLLSKIGQYLDESLIQLHDLDMYLRVVEHGKMAVVEEPQYLFRIHEGQASQPNEENSRKFTEELTKVRYRYFFKKPKIMFATPFYSNMGFSPYIRSMFQSVYALARHSTLDFDFQEVSGGAYIDNNRNMMAQAFLESDCTHLFFIDSDESWDFQSLLNILKADVDVVGAAYPVKNNWENYGVTIHVNEDGTPQVNEAGLIRAEKVPTGFMKIHRRVFEKLQAANPDDWYWVGENKRVYNHFGHLTINHIRYGEDISFNIRWQRIGGQVWLEPRCSMGHYGAQGWFGNYHEYLMRQPGGSECKEQQ